MTIDLRAARAAKLDATRWRMPAAIGVIAGVGGYVVAGPVGGAVGFVGGWVGAERPRAVLAAAAVALYATAAFTILEQPLGTGGISTFPVDRPLADAAGKVAAVLLLCGLVGMVRVRMRRPPDESGSPHAVAEPPPRVSSNGVPRMPMATIGALMATGLLATLVLWRLGDRRWEPAVPAIAVAIAAVGIGAVLLRVERLRSLPARWFAPMPGPITALNGLRREHPHVIGGSVWLLAATITVSLGSFAFWLLVTQNVPADDVGRATALFSASLFVCYLTSLGLPIAVSRYATDRTQESQTLFAWALLLRIAASVMGVALLLVLAPRSIRDALAGWPQGLAWVVVLLLVAGQSIAELVDVRLMALRRWPLVFVRSSLIAALRLPLLLWLPAIGAAFYIYVVALGGFAITGVAFLLPLAHRGWLRLRPLPALGRRAARFASVNYVGWLAVQAPFFAVPFVVLAQVGAVENAHFYLSWGVMSVVYICVQMIGQVLLVEGGRDGTDHRRQAAVSLAAGLAVTAAATLISLGLGPLLADLYGPSYGPVATLLPLLVGGTVPLAVTTTLLTTARIREQSNATVAVAVSFAVAVLVPTVLLTASDGALGAAWGWTTGNTIAAALAFFASRLGGREGEGDTRLAGVRMLAPTPGGHRGGHST